MLCAPSHILAASNCGPQNLGALPNNAHYYCLNQVVDRYNYCGVKSGTLTGLKDHPLMCGDDTFNAEQAWQPKANSVRVCANHVFEQCATLGSTTRCRTLYSQNKGWSWSPKRNEMCTGQEFMQTSNCGFTRTNTGNKQCCDDWLPQASTVCSDQTVTQTNSCEQTRTVQGTKNCCVESTWTPSTQSVCSGLPFTQTNGCGESRPAVGTGGLCISEDESQAPLNQGDFPHDQKIARLTSQALIASGSAPADASKSATLFSRKMPDNRSGNWVDYPIRLTANNLPPTSQIPVFTRSTDFNAFLNAKAANSLANNPQTDDAVTLCLDTQLSPQRVNCVDSTPRETSCGTHTMLQTCDCEFDTKGTLYPLCDECEGANLTRTINYTNSSNEWVPDPSTVCAGETVVQTNSCGDTRNRTGTRDCGGGEETPSLLWEFLGRQAASATIPSMTAPSFNCMNWFLSPVTSHSNKLWTLTYGLDSNYECSVPGATEFCWQTYINGLPGTPFGCPIGGSLCGVGTGVTFQRHSFQCQ